MGKGLPGQGSRSTSPSAPTRIMLHTAFLSLYMLAKASHSGLDEIAPTDLSLIATFRGIC